MKVTKTPYIEVMSQTSPLGNCLKEHISAKQLEELTKKVFETSFSVMMYTSITAAVSHTILPTCVYILEKASCGALALSTGICVLSAITLLFSQVSTNVHIYPSDIYIEGQKPKIIDAEILPSEQEQALQTSIESDSDVPPSMEDLKILIAKS